MKATCGLDIERGTWRQKVIRTGLTGMRHEGKKGEEQDQTSEADRSALYRRIVSPSLRNHFCSNRQLTSLGYLKAIFIVVASGDTCSGTKEVRGFVGTGGHGKVNTQVH